MVDQSTLSLSIDASEAKRGAAEFSRAASDIKRKAADMARAVDRSSLAFRNMREATTQGSSALSSAVQSGTIEGSTTITSTNEIAGIIVPLMGEMVVSGVKKELAEQRRKEERDRQIVREDVISKEFFRIATGDSGDFRELAKILGEELLKSTQTLDSEVLAELLEQEKAQLDLLNSHPEFRKNPTSFRPSEFQTALQIAIEHLNEIRKLREETERRIKDREEKLATLGTLLLPETADPAEVAPSRNFEPAEEPSLNATDDDRLKEQIDDTTRSIDQLIEQKKTLLELSTRWIEQKQQELELLQREKDCLQRLNELLQENQSLRGVTGEQSDDVLKGAAAYDDLSTAVEQNGSASKELKDQVDALNTTLQSNADINAHIVDGLEQERDARQQVNQAVGDRRQLDRDLGQRLIVARKDVADSAAEIDASIEQIRNAAKDSFKDVIKGTESVGDAFQNLADRITDILLDLALEELLKGGTGFSDLFRTVFGGIGSLFGGGAAAGPLVPASTGQLTPFLGGSGGTFDLISALHTGGIVGRDGQTRLMAANFNGVHRFHTGGVTGLAPDEIPIIAQRGEEVLTRADPRHRDNRGSGGGAPTITVNNNISFPNARNTQEAREAASEIAAKAAAAAQRGLARKGLG